MLRSTIDSGKGEHAGNESLLRFVLWAMTKLFPAVMLLLAYQTASAQPSRTPVAAEESATRPRFSSSLSFGVGTVTLEDGTEGDSMTADIGLGAAAIGLGVGLRLQRIDFGERMDYRFGVKSEYSVLKIGRLQQYFLLSAYVAHQSLDDRLQSSDLGVGGEIGVGLQFRLFGDVALFGETGFGATFWKQAEDSEDDAEHYGSVMFGLKGRF